MDVSAFRHRLIGILAEPHVVVIAADEEDRVIRSRAGDHAAEKHDRLVGNAEAQLGDARYRRLRSHQGDADRDERQQHGDRVSVDDQQDGEQHHCDREFDPKPIPITDVGEVGDGGRGSSQVCRQRLARDGPVDDLGDALVRGVGLRCAQLSGEADRQDPGLVILAGQDLAQRRCAEEILQHHDVMDVPAQPVDQFL